MNRRRFLKTCACLAGSSCLEQSVLALASPPLKKNKPNIIFILIDDMGWKDAGFMGSKFFETPNIDKLASQGMIFTDAYANAANCAPTRACLLTGQYTPRHGIYTVNNSDRGKSKHRRLIPTENTKILDTKHVTIAEALKVADYVSASMGKWHMGDLPTHGPCEQGFDVNIAGRHWGSPSGGGYHAPYKYPNCQEPKGGRYLTDRLTDEAIKFIEQNKEKPFFLYLTHYAVHTPIQSKKELADRYKNKPKSNGQGSPEYAGMLDSVDQGVGRIMQKLDELKLNENTVVFFFSDNGGVAGVTDVQPLRGTKGMFYEGGIREPMIVRWTGQIKAGTKCSVPVIGLDFFPTMLELAGTQKPKDKLLDGLSIVPLLNGAKSLGRKALFWHFPAYLQAGGNIKGESRDSKFRTRPVSVIRKGDWKLLMFHEEWVLDGGREKIATNNAVELYNLKDDIGESNNLVNENIAKRDELLDDLLNWIKETNAPIPNKPNPQYQPDKNEKA